MYNQYGVQKHKKANKPSISIKEFADLNDLHMRTFLGAILNDESISPAFNRGRKDLYHLSDLNNWVKTNVEKVESLRLTKQ